MTCVYTGAIVRVENYGLQAAADVFEVGGVLVIRFSGDPQHNKMAYTDKRPPTHIGGQFDCDAYCWARLDLGVIVVTQDFVLVGPGHRDNLRDYQKDAITEIEEYRQGSGAADGGRNG